LEVRCKGAECRVRDARCSRLKVVIRGQAGFMGVEVRLTSSLQHVDSHRHLRV
jgi:hypothetical protein